MVDARRLLSENCPADARRTEDPSALTVKMVLRELENLREVIEARLDGNDRVIVLMQNEADKCKDDTRSEVTHLKAYHGEKFDSIQTQFRERDVRTEQAAGAVKIAVDAALQAQKEAVAEQNKSSAMAIAKSENATTKQMDQIGINIVSNSNNMNDKIEDVRRRLSTIDGVAKGGQINTDNTRSNIAIGVSVLVLVVMVVVFVFDAKDAKREQAQQAPQVIYMQPAPAKP